MKGEYFCKAFRVMPTHPMAQHLGDIKDMEDYKQKIVKQRKLRNKTLKAVKKFFTTEDIDMIEKQLSNNIQEDFNVSTIKQKQKIIPKIKPDQIVARPIFKSKFERFDWHLKNGCVCIEDREWVETYQQSEEYRMIYQSKPLIITEESK
jgi:hypothetical protein